MHRQALREATSKMYPPVRLLALNWSLENLPPATAHHIYSDPIISRGDNYQALRGHEEVIWVFLQMNEGLAESDVDAYMNMDITEDLEHAVNQKDRISEAYVNSLSVLRLALRNIWCVEYHNEEGSSLLMDH
jgi:hypothetical protein